MAISISLAITSAGPPQADNTMTGTITVTNSGANTVSVQAVQIFEQSTMGAQIRQPDFLTPNAAPGVYPSISASSSATWPWAVNAPTLNAGGDSAQAPGGPAPTTDTPTNNVLSLGAFVQALDAVAGSNVTASTGTQPLQIPLVPAVTPAISLGGALQFNVANNAVNWFFF